VRLPAVYELSPGSIVRDAVEAAGGPSPDADLDHINLALELCDQQQIYVPCQGETSLPPPVSSGAPSGGGEAGTLVNINTAPAAVLAALPGLSEGAVQRIVDTRSHLDPERAGNTAWLHTDAGLSAEDFKIVAPKTTARGYQFRVRSFGYSVVHGTFSVIEAVIDLAGGEPRIVYVRDLTRLGVPLSTSGVER